MASKFQNRLVGTIILVALSVIFLPGLLDGKKKYYEDQFAAIPLVPEAGDSQHTDLSMSVNQPLSMSLSQRVPTGAQQQNLSARIPDASLHQSVVEASESGEKPGVMTGTKQYSAEIAPSGQAWVVQLGALRNAVNVNQIVATLRRSGHRAFTVPAVPVQGEITRLCVGPDTSRQKLQSALPELNRLSGLNGEIKAYDTGR